MKHLIKYFISNATVIRNLIAITLYRIGLIPKEYSGKAKSLYLKKKYHQIFFKSKLKYNENGFYYLNPMPSLNFLNEYYEKTYWQTRTDINLPVRLRDIEHYNKIVDCYKSFNLSSKKILNFGSGHGGVSYLFHVANHQIYNYDFGSTKKKLFKDRWNNIQTLENIDFKFDLIYGSHSLEHVQDIDQTMKSFKKISKTGTIYFFEVPNGYNQKIIQPPHTYYFARKFFLNNFVKVDYCKTFKGSDEMNGEEGNIIRFHTSLV